MLRLLITDAHERLNKYSKIVERESSACRAEIGEETTQRLEQAIELIIKKTKQQKKLTLEKKLAAITPVSEECNTDAWIKNLSDRVLTMKEKDLLVRGMNFNCRDAHPIDYFSHLETALKSGTLTAEEQQECRQKLIPMVYKGNHHQPLGRGELKALKELRGDQNIVIVPADKGRVTVVLNKNDYIEKAERLLQDTTTYRTLEQDQTKELEKKINKTLKKLRYLGQITNTDYMKMKATDSVTPRFYGLPKIHKEGIPLRPIVSLPGGPTYKLAKELRRRLLYLTRESDHSINSAEQFLEKIKNTRIEDDEIMVSFDVTALFTSIDKTLAMQTISSLLDEEGLPQGTQITKENLLEVLDLCLQTHFIFNGKLYEQIKGTPMGSPISGLVAEVVMQRLEQVALPLIEPKLWVRYVDDTFVIIKRSKLEEAYRLINCVFRGIQFTKEEEKENMLPFLDVCIRRMDDGELQTSVYRKATHTDQVLHFNSNHPLAHKKSCVKTLFKRARTHCSTFQLRKNEENYLYEVFRKNAYPKAFIRRCLHSKPRQEQTTAPKRFAIPYIKGVSELTARTLRPFGIAVAHRPATTLRKLLSRTKEQIPKGDKKNIVYKIQCRECNRHYVGQTGRKLSTRLHEHQLAVRRHDNKSQIAMHVEQEGHTIDWDNCKIVGQANNRTAREFIEAWHSSEQSINQHIQLDNAYLPLRMRLRRINNLRTSPIQTADHRNPTAAPGTHLGENATHNEHNAQPNANEVTENNEQPAHRQDNDQSRPGNRT